jgi:hypothetical protein
MKQNSTTAVLLSAQNSSQNAADRCQKQIRRGQQTRTSSRKNTPQNNRPAPVTVLPLYLHKNASGHHCRRAYKLEYPSIPSSTAKIKPVSLFLFLVSYNSM